ncbi:hypothetical protein K0M31_005711 [Melipona bicolor]|uniref:Uncharacterized protein n=1 Tax=Melipona bicolor TaxID=60889 RepID=A0AA40KM97_9HYME|nr:hypothetical protein K0M31_005711 [Melipona bicolor]
MLAVANDDDSQAVLTIARTTYNLGGNGDDSGRWKRSSSKRELSAISIVGGKKRPKPVVSKTRQ